MFKNFIQKIFSVKNEYQMSYGSVLLKRKIVTILGVKLKFKQGKLTDNGNKIVLIKDGKEIFAKGKVTYFDSIKIAGKNNIVKINTDFKSLDGKKIINIVGDDNIVNVESGCLGTIELHLCGNQNNVNLKYKKILKLWVAVNGNSNKVITGSNFECKSLTIAMLHLGNNRNVSIGDFTSIGYVKMYVHLDDSHIKIGNNCMLSTNVKLRTYDSHKVLDKNTREWINSNGKFIELGDHVWVGHDSTILKNVKIADNCIIGACSVVTKQFEEQNVAIAGNPAKIVKRDIDWER